jgi:hypothetical protein
MAPSVMIKILFNLWVISGKVFTLIIVGAVTGKASRMFHILSDILCRALKEK